MLELFDEEYGLLQANVSSRNPSFNVDGLEPDRTFKLLVYVANVKGRSNVAVLEANTLKAMEKPTLKFGEQMFGRWTRRVSGSLDCLVSMTVWLIEESLNPHPSHHP